MKAEGRAIRVCIVEDDRLLLGNLSMLLRGEPGMDVAGAHATAEDALLQVDFAPVDVLLVDLELPGASGVDLIGAVKRRAPAVNSVAYTVAEDRETVFAAIKAGACGYLTKGCSPRELIESIREVYDGGSPMSPRIARKVILTIQDSAGASDTGLSAREGQILRAIERGQSYKEIAATLHISTHTVHAHIKNIYEKVQAKTREDALRKARNLGVL